MSYEPFSDGGLLMQSGIPVRIKDTGGQGNWLRVPQPVAGEEGEVLTVQPDLSAAWEPATGGGGATFGQSTTQISNATLRTTNPTTLVAAQGAGTMIVPTQCALRHNYGGNNVWTNGPTPSLSWNNDTSSVLVPLNDPFQLAAVTQTSISSGVDEVVPTSVYDNQPLTFQLSAGLAGNAANDNTATIIVTYLVLTI